MTAPEQSLAVRGFHSIPEHEYHADPCEVPSLSASVAHLLCTSSPLHAWTAHPRLNPDFRPVERERFDIGTAAHAILLEGGAAITVIEAPDWRTKEAREARDEARAHGSIPLLAHVLADVNAMVDAAWAQLAAHSADPPLFTEGFAEQSVVWDEDGVVCRARLDWLRGDYQAVDDLKTTSRSAQPEAYARALFGVGGDVQAAFYVRGVEAVTGVTPEFRWAVVETHPPYALSVVAPDPAVLTLGRKKVEWAIGKWRSCLEADEWPGYPTDVAYAGLPSWEEERWLALETREAA